MNTRKQCACPNCPLSVSASPSKPTNNISSRPTVPPPPPPPPASQSPGNNLWLQFSSHLDRFDSNWRSDPFWRDLYPRWAEPIFSSGIDVKTNVVNDRSRFAVDIDTYQFRPEELQVKTTDDTLLIEGRHEDVKDRDNYTKMYFIRKYQLPSDVDPQDITSSIDGRGRLLVEAQKRPLALEGRERSIPIESASRRVGGSRSSSYSPRDRNDSGRQEGYRSDSRNTYDPNFLSPKPMGGGGNDGGFRNVYSAQSTDGNGMRHESRHESFREEVRRTGSSQSIGLPPPPPPVEQQQYHRSESRQSGYARNSYANGGTEHLLRPAEELNGGRANSRSESRNERSVHISRNNY